jgi:predicted ATPase with chaperone activity
LLKAVLTTCIKLTWTCVLLRYSLTVFSAVFLEVRLLGRLAKQSVTAKPFIFDIQIEVPALPESELLAATDGESSRSIRARVEAAAHRQAERQGKLNAKLTPRRIEAVCGLDSKGEALLRQAIATLHLSARAYHRVLKVARTIADLAGRESVQTPHVAEAVQYRRVAHVG